MDEEIRLQFSACMHAIEEMELRSRDKRGGSRNLRGRN